MNKKIEDSIIRTAGCLGTISGKFEGRWPKLKRLLWKYLLIQLIVIVLTIAYVEIGHDKGWKRADAWYTCLHTHHHFPWQ